MNKLTLFVLMILSPVLGWANVRVTGQCMQGGYTVTTQGLNSTTRVMRSFVNLTGNTPTSGCTVTVFLVGTSSKANLFSDNLGTVLANPFTADATGQWFWYANDGRYDVIMSAAGITSPFTIGDISTFDESKLWIDAESCGAVHNGSTDDSAAINACISQANAAGGGVVFLPAGIYCIISNSVKLLSNVRLEAPQVAPAFSQLFTPSAQIQACSGFSSTYIIDARQANDIGLENIAIVGDGSHSQLQTDATTTGIAIGDVGLGDTTVYVRMFMRHCSIIYNKYGVQGTLFGTPWWEYNNIGINWYAGVEFNNFAGNDGTFIGNYINSNNSEAAGIPDPLANFEPGVGLYLGYGCSYQKWIGGKIEFVVTGIILYQSFDNLFTGIDFDANSAWSIRVRGGPLWDDITTEGNKFVNLHFNGGAYASNLQGYDAHVLIEGQEDAFLPTLVAFDCTGCSFRASAPGSIYPYDPVYPKYPQNNVIATRVITGGGAGTPILNLTCSDCDFTHGSVVNGTASITGATATITAGPSLLAAWSGYTYWFSYYQPLRIVSINGAASLTLDGSPGDGNSNWYLETNGVMLDALFNSATDVKITGGMGFPNFIVKSLENSEPVYHVAPLVGNPNTGMTINWDGGIQVPYVTFNSTSGTTVFGIIHSAQAWGSSIGTVSNGTCVTNAFSVAGVVVGNTVFANVQLSSLAAGWITSAQPDAANSVKVNLCNLSGGSLTLGNPSITIVAMQN